MEFIWVVRSLIWSENFKNPEKKPCSSSNENSLSGLAFARSPIIAFEE
jgi:hypothetical protein